MGVREPSRPSHVFVPGKPRPLTSGAADCPLPAGPSTRRQRQSGGDLSTTRRPPGTQLSASSHPIIISL